MDASGRGSGIFSRGGISRREMLGGLLSLPFLTGVARAADAEGQIAIIDTPDNAAKIVGDLSRQNVRTVARYYARKFQDFLPNKVMASDRNRINGELEPAILARNNISIISAYQYRNNLPAKFLDGLSDTGSRAAEAEADATAALQQARKVSQPEGSAIYFGVDFNLTQFKHDERGRVLKDPRGRPIKNTELIDAVLEYFRAIKAKVGNHYNLGVYGNGFVNRILRQEGLVAFSWISASRAFEETSDYFSNGQWHLFQNQVDRRLFERPGVCPSGLDIDTNVQNPAHDSVGAWGSAAIPAARTQAIFQQRRFAVRSTPVLQSPDANAPRITKRRCSFSDDRRWTLTEESRIQRNNNVRVMEDRGLWVQVDIDDDGVADGFCLKSDLTTDFRRMPPW
jgi:hypothetical protein